ncbi:MAG: DNA mismatch repair protein MutS [Longimicrobiales bacterium]|nr:DNA mismatch repair protein MutS [Longimicrobiales bacterium]
MKIPSIATNGIGQIEETPLMRQWREVKSKHQDALVFFRVGDFYELFCEDAEKGSKLLGLTLTSRNNGAARRVPLAGVPAKAIDGYLERLIKMGLKVAICDQVEDASVAKGIVRREVTETVTPGTVLTDGLLNSKKNNFLVAITEPLLDFIGLASLDLSTGEITVKNVSVSDIQGELGCLDPKEILLPVSLEKSLSESQPTLSLDEIIPIHLRTYRNSCLFEYGSADDTLKSNYKVKDLKALGFADADNQMVVAAGALLMYVEEIRPRGILHLQHPRIVRSGATMLLDEMTRRNLELVDCLRPGQEEATLISILDETLTPMGARTLRKWLLRPLLRLEQILERQTGIKELYERRDVRAEFRKTLAQINDLERLAGRLGSARINPRDLLALNSSLKKLPEIRENGTSLEGKTLRFLLVSLDLMEDVVDLIGVAIDLDAPANLSDGQVIREGYSLELDELRQIRDEAKRLIANLQASERERTGINSLKVGFNKVFGYYLEVTKSNLDKIPEDYIRKQTLSNAERYFTPELKEWEERVFVAEENIADLETDIYKAVRSVVELEIDRVQKTAQQVAKLDVLNALAQVADRRGYVLPQINQDFILEIQGGRHPVVEAVMPEGSFIPNDIELSQSGRIIILTGPNMAGKSTVLRQVGLITLMAHMGSYVPAENAKIPLVDRIFTRVGASDNLAQAQSTFMLEMTETASIIRNATSRSLILLDEIGRGTSTYDGVSIAWAVTEYIHESLGAKTIFATHYHELTELDQLLDAVKNMTMDIREVGDKIIFLRLLKEGESDKSYGVHVARLAGLPNQVIVRSMELLEKMEGSVPGSDSYHLTRMEIESSTAVLDCDESANDRLHEALVGLDLDAMTPREALNWLFETRRDLKMEKEN